MISFFIVAYVIISVLGYVFFGLSHDKYLFKELMHPKTKKQYLLCLLVPGAYVVLLLKAKLDSFDK